MWILLLVVRILSNCGPLWIDHTLERILWSMTYKRVYVDWICFIGWVRSSDHHYLGFVCLSGVGDEIWIVSRGWSILVGFHQVRNGFAQQLRSLRIKYVWRVIMPFEYALLTIDLFYHLLSFSAGSSGDRENSNWVFYLIHDSSYAFLSQSRRGRHGLCKRYGDQEGIVSFKLLTDLKHGPLNGCV